MFRQVSSFDSIFDRYLSPLDSFWEYVLDEDMGTACRRPIKIPSSNTRKARRDDEAISVSSFLKEEKTGSFVGRLFKNCRTSMKRQKPKASFFPLYFGSKEPSKRGASR